MAWTTPRTWVAGEKPPAATLNTHIRDNLKALTEWTTFVPSWTNVTLGTTGLVNTGKYVLAGKVATIKFVLTLGTGGSFTGVPSLALPAGISAASTAIAWLGGAICDDNATSTSRRAASVYQLGTAVNFITNGDDAGTKNVAASNPFTWGAGDTLAGTFTLEVL